jgi:hypothetical protein
MTCKIKHYDCVEQSDCLDCRHDKLMRIFAIKLLGLAHMDTSLESDIQILANDIALVHYEPVIDADQGIQALFIQALFLSRIGGLGALPRYMKCIRTKGAK